MYNIHKREAEDLITCEPKDIRNAKGLSALMKARPVSSDLISSILAYNNFVIERDPSPEENIQSDVMHYDMDHVNKDTSEVQLGNLPRFTMDSSIFVTEFENVFGNFDTDLDISWMDQMDKSYSNA